MPRARAGSGGCLGTCFTALDTHALAVSTLLLADPHDDRHSSSSSPRSLPGPRCIRLSYSYNNPFRAITTTLDGVNVREPLRAPAKC